MAHEYELLNERTQQLLRVLVESYIREGQPVGSRALSRDSGLHLSSATIRNVMADLEELGFVASPHTSAGRIPTDRGYRFFVDTLLRSRPLDEAAVAEVRRHLDVSANDNPKALVANASQLLSNVTRLAGVVTVSRPAVASITQIEFVGLSENRVLVVLVFNDREVQNRIIHLIATPYARGAAARRVLSQRTIDRPVGRCGASRDLASVAGSPQTHELVDARCHQYGAAGVRSRRDLAVGRSRLHRCGRNQSHGCRAADQRRKAQA
ncbi:MAG: heat-inducible transcriptional repressor HrcA, partial [Gammaproteobacteria bacterium]|nr:heat-inducible transcriptional repressor HrcA [Gammaproteobacteria bacterium]